MEPSYIHLHNHSEYSLLDGALRIKDLVSSAVDMGMDAVALTDHGNLFGAIPFFREAKAAGVKPIIGIETSEPYSQSPVTNTICGVCTDRPFDCSAAQEAQTRQSATTAILLISFPFRNPRGS